MNNVLIIAILVLICFKWIVIAFVFPFQAAYGKYKSAQSNFYKVLALPYWLLEKFMRGGWERYMIFQVGHIPSCHLRKLVYRGLGVKADNNVVFHFDTEIRRPWLLRLGQGTIIGDHAILDARNGITMGENVNLSSYVSIYTEQHDHRGHGRAALHIRPAGHDAGGGARPQGGDRVLQGGPEEGARPV